MRSALAYVPREGPLQAASPGAAVAYLAALLLAAFVFPSPLVIAAAGAGLALAGVLAGARRAVAASLRMGIGLVAMVALVNAIVVDRGTTVLARLGEWPLFGRVDVTLEAVLAGLVIGLLVLVTMLGAAVYSACVDPDRVLRALRPLAGRSALTATLVARLVPVAAADGSRLGEAGRLRGADAAPVGRAALARRLLAGSLDRAVDVAASLELRGYALPGARAAAGRRPSRHDRRFHLVALAVVLAVLAAKLAGAGTFEAYPTPRLGLDPATGALAAALVLAGLAPLRRLPGARRAGVGPPAAELRGPAAAPRLEAPGG